jgi:hypothetical protein
VTAGSARHAAPPGQTSGYDIGRTFRDDAFRMGTTASKHAMKAAKMNPKGYRSIGMK